MKIIDEGKKNLSKGFATTKNWFIHQALITRIFIVVLAIGVIGSGVYATTSNKKQEIQYQTTTVERGDIIASLSQSGSVTSNNQTNVSSPTDGVIQEVYVKNGDTVVAGQNLFKVKSTATEEKKAAAYASYLNALNSYQTAQQNKITTQAALESARKTVLDAQNNVDALERNLSTSNINPSTKVEYTQNEKDAIYSALQTAKLNFTAAEQKYTQSDTGISAASLNSSSAWLAYQNTQDAIVTAPVSGTVANFSSVVGSSVTGSTTTTTNSSNSSGSNNLNSSTSAGSTVLVLSNPGNLIMEAEISQIDVAQVKAGQKATITLDAFTDKTFAGEVQSVDSIGTNTSGVVTFTAYIKLLSPPETVKSGMTGTIVIQTARKDNVLKVPTGAITTANGEATVRVMKNGEISTVTVTTGIASDTETEITEGLTEGQEVVIGTTGGTSGYSNTTSPFSTGFGNNRSSGSGQRSSGMGGMGGMGGGGPVNFRQAP